MPNLHRYTSVPMEGHAKLQPKQQTTLTQPRTSLFKWLYRKYLRLWLHGTSSWSRNCIFSILLLFAIFLVMSTHLYMGLEEGAPSSGGDSPSYRASGLESSGNASYIRKISSALPFFKDAAKMEAARQIDQQLEKIEHSLQENREILKQIRANIHSAELRNSRPEFGVQGNDSVDSAADGFSSATNYFDAIRLKDSFFYPTATPAFCVNPNAGTVGDINMARVYDTLPFDNPDGGVWKQGWDVKAPDSEFAPGQRKKLKIIVLPHSHNDPGWIKTFDTYFKEQTKSILTNAVEQMEKNPNMKFIWAEASYLSAWWETAPSDRHRTLMRKHIKDGRLELVTGGWVMNDEANTHYGSMLTQMIEGHEWLQDTFPGVKLKHGWAIDPFGLSPTMAYLLKRMGFRGMVIQRAHYALKKYLSQEKSLEFRWRQSWEEETAPGGGDDILCHLEPFYSYDVPHTCGPDPAVCCQFDFKRLPGSRVKCPWKIPPRAITQENVQERAKLLLTQYRKKSVLYRTNTLLIPLGDDFRFDTAKEWTDQFGNYQKLMDYMNSKEEMNVDIQFGTLSDYFTELFTDQGILKKTASSSTSGDTDVLDQSTYSSAFPSLVGDFFTYSDREDHYWSGYYTSKPFYKRFERVLEAHLRATEILFAMANIAVASVNQETAEDPFKEVMSDFMYARQNLALFQHHDGITGTAKDFVVKDYAKRMQHSFAMLEHVASASLQAISSNASGQAFDLKSGSLKLEFMERFPNEETPLKKRVFSLASNAKNYFVLYNSLGWTQESAVFCFTISWSEGPMPANWCLAQTVPSGSRILEDIQINHLWNSAGQLVSGEREVCFQPRLSALSLEQYCVGDCGCSSQGAALANLYQKKESFVTLYNYHHHSQQSSVPTDSHILTKLASPPKDNLTIENERIQLAFDTESGLLRQFSLLDPSASESRWLHLNASLALMTYGTRKGGKTVPKSGAYIFLPDQAEARPWTPSGKPKIRITSGRIESRYELFYTEPLPMYLRFSLYRSRRSVDLTTEFQLQGLYGANRELLVRFSLPEIQNHDRFYTDLNGFQMIGRKWYEKIPLQGNVYPLNTMAFIEGTASGRTLRFNVLTGQPLGVTSSHSGSLDVFLDRRLSQDDARGLNQGVQDNKLTREHFRLLLELPNSPVKSASPRLTSGALFESTSLLHPPLGLTSSAPSGDASVSSSSPSTALLAGSISFLLPHSLPCDYHLLSLRRATKRPGELALHLHRFGLSCDSTCTSSSSAPLGSHSPSLSTLFPVSILSKLQPDRLLPRGISLLEPNDGEVLPSNGKPLSFTSNLTIPAMEIVAYKLFLKDRT